MNTVTLVLGHAEHGKDTFADMLVAELVRRKKAVNFRGTSAMVSELVMFPLLKDVHGYLTPDECFADRREHRGTWFDAIRNFTAQDPAALVRAVAASGENFYVGQRSDIEFEASVREGLVRRVVWVHRPAYPMESPASMKLSLPDVVHVCNDFSVPYHIVMNDALANLRKSASRIADAMLSGHQLS